MTLLCAGYDTVIFVSDVKNCIDSY